MNRGGRVRSAARVGCLTTALAACCLRSAAGAVAVPLAEAGTTVSFVSPAQCVEPGALCTLQVMAEGTGDSLSCMEIRIRYDTAYAVCTGALEGTAYKQSGYSTFFRWLSVPPDTVEAVDCVLGYRSYFLPPGELVRFVFQAKKPGVCVVSFASVKLWDIDRVELAPLAGGPAYVAVCAPTGGDAPPLRVGSLTNHPNPFNPATTLTLRLPGADGGPANTAVRLDIYSVAGVRVRSLFEGTLACGANELVWDGRDDRGAVVASGVYIGVALTERGVFRRKMIVIH